MLGWLRPAMGRLWRAPAKGLLKIGVTPNGITIFGTIGVVASAIWWLPRGDFNLFIGAFVCGLFLVTDMLDGTMARLSGTSSRLGAFLDSTLDRVADAAVFGALTWAFLDVHRPTALAALACMGIGSVVPYARARAESLGIEAKMGIAERGDRLFFGLTAAGFVGLGLPLAVLTYTLIVLAVLAAITVGQRTAAVARASRKDPAIPTVEG